MFLKFCVIVAAKTVKSSIIVHFQQLFSFLFLVKEHLFEEHESVPDSSYNDRSQAVVHARSRLSEKEKIRVTQALHRSVKSMHTIAQVRS